MRETSRDYARPYRPWPVRALNAVGGWGPGRASLDPSGLVDAACRAEGLADLGHPPLRPLLERLCASIESEAQLNPLGRWITRIRLINTLRARLRMEPRLGGVEGLAPPVVIVGLPRTGTTTLHRLLAAAPGAQSLASWQALNPAPFRGERDHELRLAEARRAEQAVRYLAPDFFAVHPIAPLAPEEEVVLLDQTLLSTVSVALMHVPSWATWLSAQDQSPAYDYLARTLRVLQDDRSTHWVLKTPHHLEFLGTLVARFPHARIVMTHRDPLETQASFCSMVAHGRGLTSDRVDPHALGQEWLERNGAMMDRALEDRASLDQDQVLDIHYEALLSEPVDVVRRIHAWAGLPWSDETAQAIAAEQARSPQHRHGRHAYQLSDFGLTEAAVARRYRDYRRQFLAARPAG